MSDRPPAGRRHAHRSPSRAVYWRRRAIVGATAVATVLCLIAAAGYGYVQWRFHQIRRERIAELSPISALPATAKRAAVSAEQAPYTVLLVGDNCRDCLDGTQAAAFGSAADVGGGRSDVTMLLHVDPAADRVSVLSIPRDLWLPIPNSSDEIRVDAALNNGPGALISTIEDDLGIPVNHYVELNFDTFQKVVNALGGIDMNFPTRLYDSYSGLNVPTGCFHLDGTQALAVVRARHTYYQQAGAWQYDGLGDISRIQRDHEFLKVLASAVKARGLNNPIVDNNLVGSVVGNLTIDSTFTLSSLARLAQVFSHVDLASAPQTTLPVDEDNSPSGFVYKGAQYGDVVFPTNAGDAGAIRAFLGTDTAAPRSDGASKLPVTVVDGSGVSGKGATVASALQALGFSVTGTHSGVVDSSPAETVVYYSSGHLPQAERLASELGGAVALGQNSSIAGTGLTLVVGTNLTVAIPAAQAPITTAPAQTPAATASTLNGTATTPPTPPTRPSASASTPVASAIGGITQVDPAYPAFDPTGCASGVKAVALPPLSAPTAADLGQ